MNFQKHLTTIYENHGLFDSEVIYIYSDLRGFSNYLKDFKDKNNFLESFIKPILEKNITIILPTFSYTTSGIFNTEKTQTNLGALNKWVLNNTYSNRSEHPLFSYSAIGPKSKEITTNVGKSAFGYDSIFERLLNLNTKFLHIGRPINFGNTIIHYIEQTCGATYRYNKKFEVEVYRGNSYVGKDYSAFLRIRNIKDNFYGFDFNKASEIIKNKKIVSSSNMQFELTEIQSYSAKEIFNILVKEFYKNPLIFLKDGITLPNLDL